MRTERPAAHASSPGLLISLSGIDGTGKSTLARRIQGFLSSEYGIASRYLWCKFGDHPLGRYRHMLPAWRPSGVKAAEARKPADALPPWFKLYGQVMLAFHLAQIALVVKGALGCGQAVICDRYVYDTMVDLKQELRYPMHRARAVLDAAWIPRPDASFLLDISERAAFERKPDSRSIQFLAERRAMYLDLARDYGLTVIDTSQPLDLVAEDAIDRIKAGYFHKESVR
jgi:thymidylate kinase